MVRSFAARPPDGLKITNPEEATDAQGHDAGGFASGARACDETNREQSSCRFGFIARAGYVTGPSREHTRSRQTVSAAPAELLGNVLPVFRKRRPPG